MIAFFSSGGPMGPSDHSREGALHSNIEISLKLKKKKKNSLLTDWGTTEPKAELLLVLSACMKGKCSYGGCKFVGLD